MTLTNYKQSRSEHGSTLLIVMGIVLVLGIVLASVLRLATQEHRILARTAAWNSALPVAEAGVEEALSHLCRVNLGNRATNGWRTNGTSFTLSRTNIAGVDRSRFTVGISSGPDPVVMSFGNVLCPSAGRFIERRVQVTTRWAPVIPGLVAKTKAEVLNLALADSYDSANPLYSTLGKYDPLKYNDDTMVGCILGNVLVKDTAKVYGDVGTDTGSITVIPPAEVGDKAWVNGAPSGLQLGHSTTDLEMTFPNVTVPSVTWITSIPASQILSNANYRVASYTLGGTLRVVGNVVLYCTAEFHPTGGDVIIEPGGKLTLYYGSQFYAENGIKINANGTADQFSVFGLSTATEAYIQGNGTYLTGTIYAPAAKMYVQDTSQFCGAGACNDLVLQGSAKFHYDEMLSRIAQPYLITSWTEL